MTGVIVVVIAMIGALAGFTVGRRRAVRQGHSNMPASPAVIDSVASAGGLTSRLPTRLDFNSILETEWRKGYRDGCPVSVILVDIDLFHKFGERYGEQRREEMHNQIATRLMSELRRAGDRLAVYESGSFGVLLAVYLEPATVVGERLRLSVEGLGIPHEQTPLGIVTVSVGIASAFPRDGFSQNLILQAAVQALDRAKRDGRNCVRLAQTVGTTITF